MLISVSSSLKAAPADEFWTSTLISAGTEQDMPLSPTIDAVPTVVLDVMMHRLPTQMRDLFTGRTVPAGAVVVAPIAMRPVQDLPGSPQVPNEPTAQMSADGLRAWAYCCHDRPTLQTKGEAFFYERSILEACCTSELFSERHHWQLFDPITYGTGEVAMLTHPLARGVTDAQISEARQSAFRTGGRDAYRRAALMGSMQRTDMFVPSVVRDRSFATIWQVLNEPYELSTLRQLLWSEFMRLPRRDNRRLPARTNQNHTFLAEDLPMGVVRGLCTEGRIVQSPAAWALRRDWRVLQLFGTDSRDSSAIMLDLPVVCFTGRSDRNRFVTTNEPLIAVHTGVRMSVQRIGAFSLGAGVIPVWTVRGEVPASLLGPADAQGIRAVLSNPIAFAVDDGDALSVASREQLYDRLAALNLLTARLKLIFAGEQRVELQYDACRGGQCYYLDARQQSVLINLPALQVQPLNDVTTGVQLALSRVAADSEPGLFAGMQRVDFYNQITEPMRRRLIAGQCPEEDIYGRSIRAAVTGDPVERARLAEMRPPGAPYNAQGADPWLWDPREQNPTVTRPYLVSHVSQGLLDQFRRF